MPALLLQNKCGDDPTLHDIAAQLLQIWSRGANRSWCPRSWVGLKLSRVLMTRSIDGCFPRPRTKDSGYQWPPSKFPGSQKEKKLIKKGKVKVTVYITKWHSLITPRFSSSTDPGPTNWARFFGRVAAGSWKKLPPEVWEGVDQMPPRQETS